MTVTLDQVEAQVKALTAEEQQQLRERMDSWQAPHWEPTMPERERAFAQHLLATGIVSNVPARLQEGYRPEDEPERHPPIVVHGEPVSETVLRERR